ncbi:hypothetical protein NGRA_1427 [Nosema granulosis]|uniref:Uncharacterized protein n=1 Tax=Nosema granulosis TaxID=83296 RepID=A0A9P6KZD2_9MICR|nr:hypothetical protein NGRA_1427 [Nosema granulosis]
MTIGVSIFIYLFLSKLIPPRDSCLYYIIGLIFETIALRLVDFEALKDVLFRTEALVYEKESIVQDSFAVLSTISLNIVGRNLIFYILEALKTFAEAVRFILLAIIVSAFCWLEVPIYVCLITSSASLLLLVLQSVASKDVNITKKEKLGGALKKNTSTLFKISNGIYFYIIQFCLDFYKFTRVI